MISIRIPKYHDWPEAVIKLPEIASEEDVLRLDRLAKFFAGRHTCDGWVFTEAKGRKCWKLFCGGFSVEAGRIVHPRATRVYSVPQAILAAELLMS